MIYRYSDTFAHTITSTYGSRGVQWLTDLPTLITQCAQEWHLTKLHAYPNLTYNYVLSGYMHQTPIVLKLRCDPSTLHKEIVALSAFAQYGCVKVIAHNQSLGALLLERVIPGDPLSSLFPHEDQTATRIAANIIQQLHHAPIPSVFSEKTFPHLENMLPNFAEEPSILMPFLAHARKLKQQLLLSTAHQVLLHGDFHHENILLGPKNNWSVIDPEGIVGDPLYDIALFIRNPLKRLIHEPNANTIVLNRIHDFASILNYSPQRIYDWTYLQTVTSAYWSIEDGLDAKNHGAFLAILQALQKISH